MAVYRINGSDFEKMMLGALKNVTEHEAEINELNVFPVPDGDTGTNIMLTLSHGIETAKGIDKLNIYLRALSEGMIFGARGNSGVIISNFFDGFARSLRRYESMSASSMAAALTHAYKQAYAGCRSPKEGTILTVAREGIEFVRPQLPRNCSFEVLLGMYISRLKISLGNTPELLPVLKEAGVVDSGGMGLVFLFEGMLSYLNDKSYIDAFSYVEKTENKPTVNVSTASFNENTPFEFGYCMEFLLQLMKGNNYINTFNMGTFVSTLEGIGESVVVSRLGTRLKVHVHTFKPARVIELAQNYGEFVSFKLENMCLQHNSIYAKTEEKPAGSADNGESHTDAPSETNKEENAAGTAKIPVKDLYKIVVGTGEGVISMFEESGADFVLDGGATMNTPSGEFVSCIEKIRETSADAAIVVFPDNPNVILAAEKARDIKDDEHVHIIRSLSVAAGYFGIANDDPQLSPAERIELMRTNAENTVSVSLLKASKDYASGRISCREGDWIGLLVSGGMQAASEDDLLDVAVKSIGAVPGIEEKETAIIFKGAAADEDMCDELTDRLSDEFPDIDFVLMDGGQKSQHFVIGLI
ncbi:MAG: DAK2 domain-containing protein [Clostridia bacterium]|nr:DAK2 domain-containing protein [Clostridia bacterium]